jgi:hypothetical protein
MFDMSAEDIGWIVTLAVAVALLATVGIMTACSRPR